MTPTPKTDAINSGEWESLEIRYDLMHDLAESLEAECDQLAWWKESAMAVFAECDVQAVGKLLGLTLGSPIYPAIEPGILDLQAKLAEARNALESITHDMGASQRIHNLCATTLSNTKSS